MAEKKHINLIFIGHVDHGKSTTVGRFMYDTGALSDQEYRKLKAAAEEAGKGTFAFAYMMDNLKEERERGITIDVNYKKFSSQRHNFTIIDAPGHQDFVKNMITGTSQADAAVLVVSAKDGPQAQTQEHAFLSQVMGLKEMIVAINKMDEVNFSEADFTKTKDAMIKMLKSVGYKEDAIQIVPISAWTGDNMTKKSDNMSWWNGDTLLQALEKLEGKPMSTDKPLRLPIQDVYNIKGIGTVPVGRVETGVLKPGAQVVIMPGGTTGEVKSVEAHHEQLKEALPGDVVGFNVRGLTKQDVHRGDVVGEASNPPTVVEEFTAQIVILNHQTAIAAGYTPVFHLHTAQLSMTLIELLKKINPKTGEVVEENPKFLKTGDAAIVKIKPTRPFCAEKYKEYPQLGRFAIRDMGKTVAAGMIIDLVPRK